MFTQCVGVWSVGADVDVFGGAGVDLFDACGAAEDFYGRGDLFICAGDGG